MVLWRTNRLAYHPDYISPSGAAEIRLLIQQEHGEITHALVPPSSTSEVSVLRGRTEFYFTAKGVGRLRCADGEREEEIELSPGTAVQLPAGVHFQYDNSGEDPVEILLAVVPM